MRISALILGIIGGLIAISYGLVDPGSELLNWLVTGFSIVGLVGAGVARSRPRTASTLMFISGISILIMLGFSLFSVIPGILLLAGAFLAYLDYRFNQRGNSVTS